MSNPNRHAHRSLVPVLLVGIAVLAAPASADAFRNAREQWLDLDAGLVRQVERLRAETVEPAWISYTVPMVTGDHEICCGHWRDGRGSSTCKLERRNRSSFNHVDDSSAGGSNELRVLLRVDDGKIGEVRGYTSDCSLDAGGTTVFRLRGVDVSDSVGLLSTLAGEVKRDKLAESALSAIAYHAGPEADRVLARWSRPPASEELRGQVAFWAAVARREAGFELLKEMMADERSREVREQIVFGFSLIERPEAVARLIRIAREDGDAEIRSTALFWLGQKAGEKAVETIREAIADDPDAEVREHAVFAISQLPADEGVPILIELAKTNRHREVREQAMFWLGQSGDPRALELFEEILTR